MKAIEEKRQPLSRERIIAAAVELADKIGVDALTIRRLSEALNVKPMTIYHHVENKEAIIDGMVDAVFGEIVLPPQGVAWREAIARRSVSARLALVRHPWAVPLMESRRHPGPATLRHHDAVLACFREGGLSIRMTAHAYALIDAFIYGFAIQETSLPATQGQDMVELTTEILKPLPEHDFPYLMEFTAQHVLQPGYDFAKEFDFGLELILDGIESAAKRNTG